MILNTMPIMFVNISPFNKLAAVDIGWPNRQNSSVLYISRNQINQEIDIFLPVIAIHCECIFIFIVDIISRKNDRMHCAM